MKNKAGFISIGVLTAGLIIGTLGFVAGSTGLSKFIPGLGHKDTKTTQTSVTKTEVKPIWVKAPDGTMHMMESSVTETSTSNGTAQQKTTLGEKLLVLPKLWLLLMVLGIFFPPLAGIMGFVNRKLYDEARRMVSGVEDGLKHLEIEHPDAQKKMLKAMSGRYDESTKKLVRKIKDKR